MIQDHSFLAPNGFFGKIKRKQNADIHRKFYKLYENGRITGAISYAQQAAQIAGCCSVPDWKEFGLWCRIMEGEFGTPQQVLRNEILVEKIKENLDIIEKAARPSDHWGM